MAKRSAALRAAERLFPMKILALCLWFPYPPDNGSRVRAFYLLRELARRGHSIRLVTGAQEETPLQDSVPAELAAFCERVTAVPHQWFDASQRGRGGGLRAALSPIPRAVREQANPALTIAVTAELQRPTDAVLIFERGADSYLPELPPSLPAVIDQLEFSGDFAPGRGLTGVKSVRYWRRRLRRYRAATAVSEAEAEFARRALGLPESGAPPVHVLPNGVDTAAFSPRNPANVLPGRLVYTGSPTYAPNREAIEFFAREIFPRLAARVPAAHLTVTGRLDGTETAGSDVFYAGFLPDLRPVWEASAVAVVPLLRGGGTRIKILEAWAAGVPVVSTRVGAAGLDAVNGEHLLIADAPDDFADAVLALLADPERAAQIAANARRFVETRYDWGIIGAQLDALLTEIDDRRNRS